DHRHEVAASNAAQVLVIDDAVVVQIAGVGEDDLGAVGGGLHAVFGLAVVGRTEAVVVVAVHIGVELGDVQVGDFTLGGIGHADGVFVVLLQESILHAGD